MWHNNFSKKRDIETFQLSTLSSYTSSWAGGGTKKFKATPLFPLDTSKQTAEKPKSLKQLRKLIEFSHFGKNQIF